jgi:hypothetical protein
MNDLDILADRLDLSDEDAEIVLELCHWVDHQKAIERYGYPKDNVIPPPMEERLDDSDYVQRLLEAALDDEDVPRHIIDALRRL